LKVERRSEKPRCAFVKRVRPFFVSLLVTLFSSLPSATSSATTCVGLPSLKPVHCICGVVFFPSGDGIANAKVTVLQTGKEIAAQETTRMASFPSII
jgi:hypothetical protein